MSILGALISVSVLSDIVLGDFVHCHVVLSSQQEQSTESAHVSKGTIVLQVLMLTWMFSALFYFHLVG